MTIQPVYQEDVHVRANECDFQGSWKISYIFQALTEIAGDHAAHLGYTREDLLKNNRAWVLSRMKVCLESRPGPEASITIRTWPSGIEQKIFFRRDFELFDASGARLGAAASYWLLVDLNARRFVLPHTLGSTLPPNEGLFGIPQTLEKINPRQDLPERFSITPAYSAVDMLGHVNNARYIEWIMDCIPMAEHRTRRPHSLQINYSSEVLPGQPISIHAGQDEASSGQWAFFGMNQASGVRAFEAVLVLSQ
jgi:medium-chain acyl-[acyl-carrier-protein] hydrolase